MGRDTKMSELEENASSTPPKEPSERGYISTLPNRGRYDRKNYSEKHKQ